MYFVETFSEHKEKSLKTFLYFSCGMQNYVYCTVWIKKEECTYLSLMNMNDGMQLKVEMSRSETVRDSRK